MEMEEPLECYYYYTRCYCYLSQICLFDSRYLNYQYPILNSPFDPRHLPPSSLSRSDMMTDSDEVQFVPISLHPGSIYRCMPPPAKSRKLSLLHISIYILLMMSISSSVD